MAERTCTIDGCSRGQHARGWCKPHHRRWMAHGDPLGGRGTVPSVGVCSVASCPDAVRAMGLCRYHYWRSMYAERKAFIDLVKLQRGCADCGFDRSSVALQFDHRDPSTKHLGYDSMASNLGRGWVWILAEIAKCDVRCANCHATRTHAQSYAASNR